jgi:uncharacterized protein YidB (DUF937 family)
MTISPIDLGTIQQTQYPRHPMAAAMSAAAQLLGMAPSDVRSALEGGQTLADLAKSKGISQDDLVKAMASAIQQARPGLSTDQATQIATQIATRVPGAGANSGQPTAGTERPHHHHHHGHGGDVMNAVSQVLGESTSQIGSALQGGQSLTDLAKSQGVSQDDLVKAVATALQQDNPNLTSDVATQLATTFANASASAGRFVSVQA